jgi:hypothetical protein
LGGLKRRSDLGEYSLLTLHPLLPSQSIDFWFFCGLLTLSLSSAQGASAPIPHLEREMVMDEPLDFEEEDDPLFPAPRPTKRKKVIGLDDLLLDYFGTGKDLRKVKAAKTKHGPMGHDSDEEDKKGREDEICKIFEDCEEKAKGLDARDDVTPWGQQIFGCQVKRPYLYSVCLF